MKTDQLLLFGALGAAGWYLWKHQTAPVTPHPDDVTTCLTFKPGWTQPQCQQRLTDLKTAFAGAKAQLATILAPRAALVSIGDYAKVAQIDKDAAPWRTAMNDHAQDYWNLTGTALQ